MDAKALGSMRGGMRYKAAKPSGWDAAPRDAHRRVGGQARWPQQGSTRRHSADGLVGYVDTSPEATTTAMGEMPRMYETVGDIMTTAVFSVSKETPVTDALDLVVKHRITGMPVVDANNVVIGVVSDYDLLALDLSSNDQAMFPSLDMSWQTFREIQTLMSKIEGQTVEDVMTEEPVTVRPHTSLDMASRALLESKIRRLPVVDMEGKLVGLLSRRNIVVAALADRRRNGAIAMA